MPPEPTTPPPPPTLELESAILRMVLYFDVFRHPLSAPELTRLVCPELPATVEAACAALVARGRLGVQGPFYFRPGEAGAVSRRQARAAEAERAWPRARAAAEALSRFPFVRGLLVTGSLSKNSAGADGDVDWLVLVEPGRVWTLKSALQVFRRALPERARASFCTNYLLDTDHLAIDDRNLFTAIELATAVPVAGPEAATALIDANPWAARYVPGLSWSRARAANAAALRPGPLTRGLDRAWRGSWTTAVERQALQGWRTYWDRKYGWLDEGARAQRFKRRDEIATNHLHDFQDYVLREAGARFAAEGLDGPLREAPARPEGGR